MKALVTVMLSALKKNIIRFKCSGVFHFFFAFTEASHIYFTLYTNDIEYPYCQW